MKTSGPVERKEVRGELLRLSEKLGTHSRANLVSFWKKGTKVQPPDGKLLFFFLLGREGKYSNFYLLPAASWAAKVSRAWRLMMLFNQPGGEGGNKRDDKKDDRLREEEQEIAMKLAPSYALLSDWNSASVDINSVSGS